MELGVLGPVEMFEAGGAVPLGPSRQRAVMAALVVDCGQLVPVDVLVDRVWGIDAPERAARTLHTYITRLRRLIGTERLVRRQGGYVLEVDRDRVDLHRFRRLVAEAGNGAVDAAGRVARLREAVRLWRGQPLAGIGGDWAERMRRSWRDERVDAAVSWADAELAAGDPATVQTLLRELIEEHPLVEPLVEAMMRALAATGRTAEALLLYAALRRRLADELGADPGPDLQATHQTLLRLDPPPPPRARPSEPVRSERQGDTRPGRRSASPLGTGVAAALGAWSVAVLPLLAASVPSPVSVQLPWTAHTTGPAPLISASGELLRTLPADTAVTVYCWFPGDPGEHWLGDGFQYHVDYPAAALSGHIPDPYLTFAPRSTAVPPTDLRRCRPTSAAPTD